MTVLGLAKVLDFRAMFGLGFQVGFATVLFLGGTAQANAPSGRFASGSGAVPSVVDTKTNLTWQQPAATTTYTWANAKAYCPTLGTGWRLPTVKELATLVDYSVSTGVRIDPIFGGTQANSYWSSTLMAASPGDARLVNFSNGYTDDDGLTAMYNVRCVR